LGKKRIFKHEQISPRLVSTSHTANPDPSGSKTQQRKKDRREKKATEKLKIYPSSSKKYFHQKKLQA
jgi:hypothetical protein